MKEMERKKPSEERKPDSGGYALQEVRIRLTEGQTLYSKYQISSAQDAIDIMREELAGYDREVVCIVNLNTRNQPITRSVLDPSLKPVNFNIVSIGNLNTSMADISYLLRSCILTNSAAFLMLHNHPSGDPTPSETDILLTRRVVMAGAFMGIPCLDHIIVGAYGKEYYSMRENNTVDFNPGMEEAGKEMDSMVAETAAAYAPTGPAFDSPFGNVPIAEVLAASEAARKKQERPARSSEQLTITFGRGLCSFFTSKKTGKEMCAIKIPGQGEGSWPQFVLPADRVRDSRFGKGVWARIPADGRTTLTVSRRVEAADGSTAWQKESYVVTNWELKEMVEAYKKNPEQDRGGDGQEKEEERHPAWHGR